jgi:spore germination protein
MVMVFSTVLANGVMVLPRVATELGGPGGWMVVLVQGIITTIALMASAKVCSRFPSASFVNLSKKVLGSFIGTLVSVIIAIYFTLVASFVSRGVSDIASTAVLPQTPLVVLIGLMLVVAAYAIYEGIEVLARTNTLLFVIKIGALLTVFFMSIPDVNLDNLLPLWDRGDLPWFEGVLSIHSTFSGFFIFAFLYPNINNHENTVKMASLGLMLVVVSYVAVTVIATAIFGCLEVSRANWPTLFVIREVPFPMDAPFMMAWVISAFSVVAGSLYIASDALKDILILKDYRSILLPLIIIVIAFGLLPKNSVENAQFTTNITIIGFAIEILLPFIMLALVTIIGRGKSKP